MILKRRYQRLALNVKVYRNLCEKALKIRSLQMGTKALLQEGEEILVYIADPEDNNGNIILSYRRAAEEKDWLVASELLESQEAIETEIVGFNKGGVLVSGSPGSQQHLVAEEAHHLQLSIIQICLDSAVFQASPAASREWQARVGREDNMASGLIHRARRGLPDRPLTCPAPRCAGVGRLSRSQQHHLGLWIDRAPGELGVDGRDQAPPQVAIARSMW